MPMWAFTQGRSNSDFLDDEYNGAPPAFPEVRWRADPKGAGGGIQLSYNRQYQRFVIGIEGEAGYMNIDGPMLQPGGILTMLMRW